MSAPLVTVFKGKSKTQPGAAAVHSRFMHDYPYCGSPLIPGWLFALMLIIFLFAGILCGVAVDPIK